MVDERMWRARGERAMGKEGFIEIYKMLKESLECY
jgi:hypothetical protein